jgi:hypothetical protein
VTSTIVARPIRDGKLDEWRAFVSDLMGPRRAEWAQSKRRRGIRHVTIATAWHDNRPLAVLYVSGEDPEAGMSRLAESADPFDAWLTGRQAEILGDRLDVQVIGDTAPPSGPWKGAPRRPIGWRVWRRWRSR